MEGKSSETGFMGFVGLGSCQNRGLARITRMTRILAENRASATKWQMVTVLLTDEGMSKTPDFPKGFLFTVGFRQEGGGMDITV